MLLKDSKLKSHCCLFCYKDTNMSSNPNDYNEEELDKSRRKVSLERYFKSFDRLLNNRSNIKERYDYVGKAVQLCSDCCVVIEDFNELYHQMKCLELKIHWRLRMVENVAKLAEKVPSRMKTFRKKYPNETERRVFKDLRKYFVTQCSRYNKQSTPKVILDKQEKEKVSHARDSLLSPEKLEFGTIQHYFQPNDNAEENYSIDSTNIDFPESPEDLLFEAENEFRENWFGIQELTLQDAISATSTLQPATNDIFPCFNIQEPGKESTDCDQMETAFPEPDSLKNSLVLATNHGGSSFTIENTEGPIDVTNEPANQVSIIPTTEQLLNVIDFEPPSLENDQIASDNGNNWETNYMTFAELVENSLISHSDVTERETSFVCEHCGDSFTHWHNLRFHERNQHVAHTKFQKQEQGVTN